MVKKRPDPSLRGKKPANKAKRSVDGAASPAAKIQLPRKNPSHIANKLKRSEMYGKYLQQKRAVKKEARLRKAREVEELGEGVQVKKPVPKTLDNTRDVDPTMVLPEEIMSSSPSDTAAEIAGDEADDEFAPYFDGTARPKVLVTTRPRPSQCLFYFIADLQKLIPGLHFYPRKSYSVKEICQFASNRGFTHLVVLSEKSKKCNGMTISHLRRPLHRGGGSGGLAGGPTAFFKLTNVVTSQNIPNHGASTSHVPELNLHGFGTRLGHRIGRLLGSLFPHDDPQFRGRQVVTFHNQRDYVFVRQHRYIFEKEEESALKKKQSQGQQRQQQQQQEGKDGPDGVKTRLQELGPRFTLKLRWLQEGTFDTKYGEYEWIHKRKEMDATRRTFHL